MAKQTEEILTFEIGITKHVSATWPDMDFRAVCHLDQHDTAPGVTLAVRATTEKQAGELCGQMRRAWMEGERMRRRLLPALLERDECPYEIEVSDPGEEVGGVIVVDTGILSATIEIPFPDDDAVGMIWVDMVEPLSPSETAAPEKGAELRMVRHYNHWAQGQPA